MEPSERSAGEGSLCGLRRVRANLFWKATGCRSPLPLRFRSALVRQVTLGPDQWFQPKGCEEGLPEARPNNGSVPNSSVSFEEWSWAPPNTICIKLWPSLRKYAG